MKIVVVGANGMLGSDIVRVCRVAGIHVDGYDLPALDISNEKCNFSVLPECDWVINCAAYTNVDGAETDWETAFAVNADGAGRLAAWSWKREISFMHISSDYVFDGTSSRPYKEEDQVNPLNKYGESKLAGERAVRSACRNSLIVRTQSLFGVSGVNFVKTIMRRLAEDNGPIRVVDDQRMSPTSTVHLARAILGLLKLGKDGIIHVSASGNCTWYEFACAIAGEIRVDAEIVPIKSSEIDRPARRPTYSVLDNGRYEEWTSDRMPLWREGMLEYLRCLE